LSEWCDLTPAMQCHAVNIGYPATLQPVSLGGPQGGGTEFSLATPKNRLWS